MARQQFLPKLICRKQRITVLLLPTAGFIIMVLLSLPFPSWIAARARLQKHRSHTHRCLYSGFTLKKTKYCHRSQQGLHDSNVMINRSEVWKQYIRLFENWCDNQTRIVPVQHASLSDNNPCTSALTVHKSTFKSQSAPDKTICICGQEQKSSLYFL